MATCGFCGSLPREASTIVVNNNRNDNNNNDKYPHKRWMGDLVASKRNVTLKRMVLPGSHQTATYSIPSQKIGSAVAKTQNLTIREQLLLGVRFLDLRIASNSNSNESGVNIFHGPFMGCTFEAALQEISGFCEQFPTEFVVLRVKAESRRPFVATDKQGALESMRKCFGNPSDPPSERLLCKADRVESIFNSTLQHVIEQRGRVCVLLDPNHGFYDDVDFGYDTPFQVKKEYEFFDASQWLFDDEWHETSDAKKLQQLNLEHIRHPSANREKKFVNSQFVLTPDPKAFSITGRNYLTPMRLANKQLYQSPKSSSGRGVPFLHRIILENPDEAWNIISLDFVGLAPAALPLFIGMNFCPLKIELALLGGGGGGGASAKNVTNIVSSKVLKGSCLFLHPKHDFTTSNREESTMLTLVYKISEKLYTIAMNLEWTDVVLLNQHNHLSAGGTLLTIGAGKGNKTKGIITTKSGAKVTWEKTAGEQGIRFGHLS